LPQETVSADIKNLRQEAEVLQGLSSKSVEGKSMNRRRQIQLTPGEQAAFFRKHRKAALATIDKDGFPHVVAMNFYVKDGAFYMTSYGKAQKVVNIRRNPKVALMIEEGNAYSELRGVMVRGHCEIIEGADAVRAAFAGMAEARGTTYARPQRSVDSAPKRVVLKIIPEKITSWDHSKLGGVY
jgi:PPOX class probable F420-dependent enzyme